MNIYLLHLHFWMKVLADNFNEKTHQILLSNLSLPHVLDRRLGQDGDDKRRLGNPKIRLIDMGGTCYEDYTSKNHEDALQNAENYLRMVDFPARFDKETIASLEEDYNNRTP